MTTFATSKARLGICLLALLSPVPAGADNFRRPVGARRNTRSIYPRSNRGRAQTLAWKMRRGPKGHKRFAFEKGWLRGYLGTNTTGREWGTTYTRVVSRIRGGRRVVRELTTNAGGKHKKDTKLEKTTVRGRSARVVTYDKAGSHWEVERMRPNGRTVTIRLDQSRNGRGRFQSKRISKITRDGEFKLGSSYDFLSGTMSYLIDPKTRTRGPNGSVLRPGESIGGEVDHPAGGTLLMVDRKMTPSQYKRRLAWAEKVMKEPRGKRSSKELWSEIVSSRENKIAQLRDVLNLMPSTRWTNKGELAVSLGQLKTATPLIRARNWNSTIRKQLNRINKMDRVFRVGNRVVGVNRDNAGKVALVRSVTWTPQESVAVSSGADGHRSERHNNAGNLHPNGRWHFFALPRIGKKRIPKGLRKVLNDVSRKKYDVTTLNRLPASGDKVFRTHERKANGGTRVTIDVMSPPDAVGLRDTVMEARSQLRR